MSEYTTTTSSSLPDDLSTWLAEAGPDAYALVQVTAANDPVNWPAAQAPGVGLTGVTRPDARPDEVAVQEVGRGTEEALRRWLLLDDGRRQLAIIGTDYRGMRHEYTPGELAASLLRDPPTDRAQITGWRSSWVTDWLSSWLYRRSAESAQGRELGWVAAAAAWACHMRDYSPSPPPAVLSRSLARAGEVDDTGGVDAATEDLIVTTTRQVADILDRLQDTDRPCSNLAEDWKALEALSADVPALKESAGWLLDQIALRDVNAQRLRAVLEPDITDYQRDRDRSIDSADAPAPALDEERVTQLSQARDVVRAYTAAAHSGREAEAQHLLDAFPVPARPLQTSGPAAAWRRNSPTAQDAVTALETQRAATTADDSSPYVAAPELLHATTAYLAAREGQLHHLHDALGRLAYPAQSSAALPTDLAPVAAAQTQRRVIDAFGTPERARQALDGQISYQHRHPTHADRPTTPGADTTAPGTDAELLTRARAALEEIDGPGAVLDAEDISTRLQRAMARPATPPTPARGRTGGHDQTQADQAHAQARAAGVITPGVQR
ncbi:hypothetical protein ACFQ9Z_38375 [Streptomyces sp. NPDC056580]|uniref:hypothetical protein n=1 Tax=Streptomyces sp. NPDC056580 TaxID=3345872 RepID=UPI0036BA7589